MTSNNTTPTAAPAPFPPTGAPAPPPPTAPEAPASHRYLPLVASHLKRGIPVEELACSDRDRIRLRAIFRCWDAYQKNPFTRAIEWFTHKEQRYISPKFLPTALEIFEHIRSTYEAYNPKHDRDIALWTVRNTIQDSVNCGDRKLALQGAKQLAELHNGFAEDADKTQSRSALPIILVHATTKNPESIDYTDAALEEEMRKWNASIDPTFQAIQDRARQLEARTTEITEADFEEEKPNYLTDDLFDEYD